MFCEWAKCEVRAFLCLEPAPRPFLSTSNSAANDLSWITCLTLDGSVLELKSRIFESLFKAI